MAAASVGFSHLGVTDNQKRWLVVGIGLSKVLIPQIRPFVEQEVMKEYNNLKTSHNIHIQTTSGRLQRWPPRKFLKYENINGNDAHPKLSGGKCNYSLFDCGVLTHIDFARLYVENYMAKFNAFDENCDASAVLLLLGGVPVFSAGVQAAATDVRMARNDWAHCVFSKWDQAKFQQSFIEMKDLVRAMALPTADEGKILGELNDWETKGTQLCMNSPVDPALLQLIHQEVKSLEDNVNKLSLEFEEERVRVRQVLLKVAQSVLRLETGQQNLECRTGIVEERVNDIEGRISDFEEKVHGLTTREKEPTLTSSLHDVPAAVPEKLVELIRRDYKGAVLCPFPWCEDELQLELSNIFTRLQIVSKRKDRAKLTDDTVNMTDVFRPHAECAKPRVVLIEGDPGIGKTTYCQKLAYDWSMGEIPPEASFPKVETLFLLKCRDMNTADIEEAIGAQLLPEDADKKEKEKFFQSILSDQSRILLVLDGLDELRRDLFQGFMPLIQGKVFANTFLMLTARQEAGMKVRRYCDTLLEIVGYTGDDAANYIEKYFSNHGDPSLAEKMIEKLQSDKKLRELAVNPLNTSLLCLLCEETCGMFPSKRTEMYDALVECALRRYFAKRGVLLDEDNPIEKFSDQLNQLGKMALEALLKNQLYFSANEMKCQSNDFLQLCFLSREPSTSKIRPTPCYAFTHKTFQEYFAALYLAHQVLTGDQGIQSLLAQLSPVDNWQVWEFLFTMVTNKNSEKGVFVVSRLCAFFYHERPRRTMDSIVDAECDMCICEDKPVNWRKYSISQCLRNFSEEEKGLIAVVTKTLHLIAECEDGENDLKDYQTKMVRVVAHCCPVYSLELTPSSRYCFVYSEYLKTNSTLTYLYLSSALNELLLTTISDVFHLKHKLTHFDLVHKICDPFTGTLVPSCGLTGCYPGVSQDIDWTKAFGAEAFARVLQSGSLLTHLNLVNVWIFDGGVQALTNILQANTLTHLSLEKAMIGDPGAIELANVLRSNCTLLHLNLPCNLISDVGAGALADGLQTTRTLKCLNLSNNVGGNSVAHALARALESKCGLTNLYLRSHKENCTFAHSHYVHCELIGPSGASALARALRLNYMLTYLDLQENAIGNSGAAAIAEALQSNCTLTHLYLASNEIGDSGAEALGKALQSNCTLTHLDVRNNRIGNPGGKTIAKALQSNGIQLTRLDLASNKIGSSSATAIADALRTNQSLTRLRLSSNKMGSSGAVAVGKALQSNCTLTHLFLGNNDINDSGVTELAHALQSNCTLTHLFLGNNDITDSGVTKLAQAVNHNHTLIFLNLINNPISSLGEGIIGQVREHLSCIFGDFNISISSIPLSDLF